MNACKLNTRSGGVRTPYDCYEILLADFGETWAKRESRKAKKIEKIDFFWVPETHIQRPAKADFEKVVNIRKSFQFLVLGLKTRGAVLQRSHSCWCRGCTAAAAKGPGAIGRIRGEGYVSGECELKNDPFYQWMERTCASLDEYGPERSRAEIRKLGQAIAMDGLEPGTWVLCEARQTSQDRGQELWLGRTVGHADWGGACVREAPVPAGQRRKKFDGVMFDQGEYQVNIQWVERDDDGDEFCLDFHDVAEEEPVVQSATQLRLALDATEVKDIRPAARGRRQRGSAATPGTGRWRILQTNDPTTDPYSRAFDNCFPEVRVAAGGLGPDAMDMEAKENDT